MALSKIVEDRRGLSIGTDTITVVEFNEIVFSEELSKEEGDRLFLEQVHAVAGARKSELKVSHRLQK